MCDCLCTLVECSDWKSLWIRASAELPKCKSENEHYSNELRPQIKTTFDWSEPDQILTNHNVCFTSLDSTIEYSAVLYSILYWDQIEACTEVTRKRCLWLLKSKPGQTDQISTSMDKGIGPCSLGSSPLYGGIGCNTVLLVRLSPLDGGIGCNTVLLVRLSPLDGGIGCNLRPSYSHWWCPLSLPALGEPVPCWGFCRGL
jgi:hypothetical protein